MKKALIAALILLLVGVTAWGALDKTDYRGGVYWTDRHNKVIGGITSTGYFESLLGINFLDDVALSFGGGGGTAGPLTIEWTTADPNANCFLIDLPTGGVVDVPVMILASADANFGYFNGIVEPTLAVENLAGTSWIALDHSGTTLARLQAGGAATYLTIATELAGADIVLDANDAAAGMAQQYVSITGTIPAHASGTPTDIFLDITPTVGINTAAADVHLIDLTFTTQVWGTAVASNFRGIYFAPTIGNATTGTNTIALIDVAAITGDAEVSLYGIRAGALTGTGATENFIDIGSGWDAGLTTASPIVISTAAGSLDFSGATSATISTSTGTCDIVLDSADDAAGSDKTYVSITGSVPAHLTNTPTSIFLDITPTVGIPTVDNTVNIVDLTFTTPIYATAVVSTYRGLYFAPTIGAATLGTNTVALMDVAAITGDDTVSLYGLRFGALTGTGATEEAITIGAGWDNGINTASPVNITGNLTQDGTTVSLDGSTSVRGISAGFTSLESPANRLGINATEYIQFATTVTTGDLAITHTGNSPDVTWTADSFDLVGAISLDATTFSSTLTTENGNGAIVADKITVVEYIGEVHKSTFTFVLTGTNDLDLADGDHGTGIKVYDLPEGRILILGATIDGVVVTSSNYNASPNDVFVVSMGTVVGADDNALTGTEVDIIPSTELDTIGASSLTLDWHAALSTSAQFDGTSTPVDIYVNVACTDASNSGTNTYAVTGTATLMWVNLGDY